MDNEGYVGIRLRGGAWEVWANLERVHSNIAFTEQALDIALKLANEEIEKRNAWVAQCSHEATQLTEAMRELAEAVVAAFPVGMETAPPEAVRLARAWLEGVDDGR